jgi:hypothetical protein
LLQGQTRIGLGYLTGAPQNNHAFWVNLGSRTQDCSLHENNFLDAEAIAGIGPLGAIAIMTAIGNGAAFQTRDLASRQNRILPSTTAKGPKP